ncbi:MAG: hypothetical protein IT379_24615 [Deltaproteobacteria bacterium]|nr:hypothetical protein [Deltaproteobacteria bacterium]
MVAATPKATPSGDPDLALYALAQARYAEAKAALPKCAECTGDCHPPKRPVLGRIDWPTCPIAMITQPPWTDVMAIRVGAMISPNMVPPRLSAWAYDALIEQHLAQARAETERARRAASGGLPKFSETRAASSRGGG